MKKTHISSFDKYNAHNIITNILLLRNLVNHNSYNYIKVKSAIQFLLKNRVVEDLYNRVLGSCEGYDIFVREAYAYLADMKCLWEE